MATAAPQTLTSTYKRYKAGTRKLLSWLATSAAQCPCPTSDTDSKFTTQDLIRFAEQIASSKDPVIEIPLEILDITQDAITGRAAAARFYAGLAAETDESASLEEANASHAHFLHILQRVFDVLKKEHKSRRPKRKKKMPELPSDINDLTNLYQHLEFEETAPDLGTTPRVTTKKQAPSMKTPQEHELDSDEEKWLAIYCLFKDLMDIRLHVQGIWSQYSQGDLTFFTASKLTESAMAVSYEIATEFEHTHPDLEDFEKIVDFIGARKFLLEALNSDIKFSNRQRKGMEPEEPSAARKSDLLCMQAWRALDNFRRVVPYVWASDKQRGRMFGGKEPKLAAPGHPFAKVLVNVAFELRVTFSTLAAARSSAANDAYLSVLLRLGTRRTIDTGLLAATQIYITMYDALQGDMSRGLRESEAALARLFNAFDTFSRQCSGGSESGLDQCDIKFGVHRNGSTGWSVNECVPNIDGAFFSHEVLAALPLLPVAHAYFTIYGHQTAVVDILSEGAIVLSCAHLYKGGRAINAIKSEWSDMEHFLERQNSLGIVTRAGDGSVRSVLNCFGLDLGLSLSQVKSSKAARLPPPTRLRKVCTTYRPTCRYLTKDMALENMSRRTGVIHSELRLLYEVVKQQGERIVDPIIKEQFCLTRKLTAIQLLQVAQEVIVEDEPYLYFDYYAFWARCLKWLRQAKAGRSAADFFMVTPADKVLYMHAHNIIRDAANAEIRGQPISETRLYSVGEMATTFINEEGDACLKECLGLSSGFLPDQLKSAARYPEPSTQFPMPDHVGYLEEMPGDLDDLLEEERQQRYEERLQRAHDSSDRSEEAEMNQEARDFFNELITENHIEPRKAAQVVEEVLAQMYLQEGIHKHPLVHWDNGILSINTRPLTYQELVEMVKEFGSEKREAILRQASVAYV